MTRVKIKDEESDDHKIVAFFLFGTIVYGA